MDNAVINHVIKTFEKEMGIDLNDDPTALQRVREAAEKAKIELSTVMQSEINLPFISATQHGPKHLQMTLTRAKLEELVDPLVKRCKKSVDQALNDAGLKTSSIAKVILVGGPTRMPIVLRHIEEWFPGKVARGVDPMECVAMGAAVQAGVLAGEVKDILLLDVTPLSLGIETLGGVFTSLIERNTTIPAKKSQVFSTAADNQPAVTIRIAQGERPMFNDNKLLGQFDLVGIPAAPRGVPQIEVTFDIDANGILHVTAKDLGTSKEQSLRITAPHKLDEKEVERMRKEAEKFADEDKKRKESVEAVNQADSLVWSTEKTLKELGEKYPEKDRKDIEAKMAELKKLLEAKDKDVAAIKKASDALTEVAQKAATALYQQAAAAHAKEHPHDKEGKADGENVVDADFEEKSAETKKKK
jgi:molecular chaperone DnaK